MTDSTTPPHSPPATRYPAAKMAHEDNVYLAKLAEQAERYEGMLISNSPQLKGTLIQSNPSSRDG